MTFSLNNKLIVEQYVKEGLKAERQNGIAIPGQRDNLKGLKVLMDAHLSDGRHIPKGAIVYVREETLHAHPWASKPFNCSAVPVKFLVLETAFVEFYEILEGTLR